MFDNNLVSIIKNIGATKKESLIYLTLLQYGAQSASSLSRLTKINRSTLYYHIAKLKKKGLIIVSKKVHGETFQANHPNHIISLLNDNVAKAQSTLENFREQKQTLETLSYQQKIPSQYLLYEGKQAIEIVHDRILASEKSWSMFNIDIFSEVMGWDIFYIRDVVTNHSVHSYEILFDTPKAHEYVAICTEGNPEVKIWKNSPELFICCVIFEDSYIGITMEDTMQLFEIKDQKIVALHKAMFKKIWHSIS